MLTRPASLWAALLVPGAFVFAVVFIIGYGLIIFPMLLLGAALVAGAALYHFLGE